MRNFINLSEFDKQTLSTILKHAHELKAQKFAPPQLLKGLTLAMMFDKLSTRTRMSFEVAMKQLGGHTVVLSMNDTQLGGAESIESTAQVMSRYVDAIMIRMSDHTKMEELAHHASVPIVNGMTDISHPCQIMASVMTIEEKLGSVEGKKIAWFGDYNNVTQSYMDISKILNFEFIAAMPEDIAQNAPDKLFVTSDVNAAAKDADVIVTDTWVSLGQDGKAIEKFWPYQVNAALMAQAKDNAIFTHCLPMHEWEEVSEDVAKSSASVIYDEAENRLHIQKAILAWCLADAGVKI